MLRKVFVAASLAMLMSVAGYAQMPEGYLDVTTVRVKPDKSAEFDAIGKKIAEAERKNHGDNWTAMATAYGANNEVTFVSARSSYADAEKASDAMMGALNKAYGPGGADKMFQEFNNTVVSVRSEFRRRRWDLSVNAPADPAAYAKFVGETRWLRTVRVHVRPGHSADYEKQLLVIKAGAEKADPSIVVFVSEGAAGQEGTVYYLTWLKPSLGGFDHGHMLKDLIGDDAHQDYLKVVGECVQGSETAIYRFAPDISNPPADVVAASPEFWTPKPKAAPKPKPKADAAKPAAAPQP
ncbi:MAG TPA: hypothetical protein VL523_18765 [Terriglobia bacterium]|nr:hypothetical protein [Terriglobia bacterium]